MQKENPQGRKQQLLKECSSQTDFSIKIKIKQLKIQTPDRDKSRANGMAWHTTVSN